MKPTTLIISTAALVGSLGTLGSFAGEAVKTAQTVYQAAEKFEKMEEEQAELKETVSKQSASLEKIQSNLELLIKLQMRNQDEGSL